jgi:hypothetical protein
VGFFNTHTQAQKNQEKKPKKIYVSAATANVDTLNLNLEPIQLINRLGLLS